MSETIFSMIGTTSSAQIAGQSNTNYIKDFSNFNSAQLTFGGGSTSANFTIPGLTSKSVVVMGLANFSSPTTIKNYTLSNNTLAVTFNADPGANTIIHIMYTIIPEPITS